MKDQYFGDVNDFRKYGLLRALAVKNDLRLGVCWMLTPKDNRGDGELVKYLSQPKLFQHLDEELFDWLKQVVVDQPDRRTAKMEASSLLGAKAKFKSDLLDDNRELRQAYFDDCVDRFAACDLIFFDPDNGLEVKSKRRGHRNSCKYLYWDEVVRFYNAGSSVLIYQHFNREKRDTYIARRAKELHNHTGADAIFSFQTPHVVFLLAPRKAHESQLQNGLPNIQELWALKKQIVPAEFNLNSLVENEGR